MLIGASMSHSKIPEICQFVHGSSRLTRDLLNSSLRRLPARCLGLCALQHFY
jgi:hypothetical protein